MKFLSSPSIWIQLYIWKQGRGRRWWARCSSTTTSKSSSASATRRKYSSWQIQLNLCINSLTKFPRGQSKSGRSWKAIRSMRKSYETHTSSPSTSQRAISNWFAKIRNKIRKPLTLPIRKVGTRRRGKKSWRIALSWFASAKFFWTRLEKGILIWMIWRCWFSMSATIQGKTTHLTGSCKNSILG